MSNINVVRKNLGPVTAYKYAVQQGYTGTEQEFAALMASYATVAEEAESAKDDAVDAKIAAEEAQAAAEAAAEQAEGAIEVDDTLSVRGRAADAKKTGDKIRDIKTVTVTEETNIITENIYPNIIWASGYIDINGGDHPDSETFRHSQKIAVNNGDVIAYKKTNYAFRFITAYDGDAAIAASGDSTGTLNSYTVPSGINFIVISDYVSRGDAEIYNTHPAVTYKNILDDDITALQGDISDINARQDVIEGVIEDAIVTKSYTYETVENIFPSLTWANGYMGLDGTTYPSETLRYSNKIPVLEGDVIAFPTLNLTFNLVTAFLDNTAISASGVRGVSSYTVPSGINYVVLTEYISRGTTAINKFYTKTETSAYVKPIPMGYMASKGNLSNGDRLTLPYMQVKNYNQFLFSANVTAFSKIIFGGGTSITIDSTNITIGSTVIAHGITIGNTISLLIETETAEYISHIRFSSDGAEFDYTTAIFYPSTNASKYIESDGSTLTNCVLSWVSKNVNAPIWMFGDSYFSWYQERWTYYANRDGYLKNVMLNGYAGQASDTAYNALVNLLAITTPKKVVWCLGMNNGDSDSAVNASWYAIYQKVIELQKKYGFELILYTVPTTPAINNDYKNAIIRTSGYRYIDTDLAVRIDNEGHWIAGALNGDNVHPTAIGAKILYYRILADLPEIMCIG